MVGQLSGCLLPMWRMHRGFLSAALLIAALFVAGATSAAAGAPSAAATGGATFSDPAGDTTTAPDITAVSVSNDDQGLVTFRATIANRTALGVDDVIAIGIGTNDPDPIVGKRDDSMNFILGLGADGAFLLRWDGESMAEVDPQPGSVTGSFTGGVAAMTVRQEDLGPGFPDNSVPISFDFFVLGILFSGFDVAAQDDAPDGTNWSFKLSEPLRSIVTSFGAAKSVKAGNSLVALLGVAHGDTGAAVRSGKVSCKARLGTKPLKGVGKFVAVTLTASGRRVQSPNARCTWKIPKSGKNKTVKGSITVTESGLTVTRSFSAKVR
jgi:hypothetical protein